MTESKQTYHRTGEPGGPGCELASMDVTIKNAQGESLKADLLCANKQANELEMLRTIAFNLGVKWGHDDLGWWAVVQRKDS